MKVTGKQVFRWTAISLAATAFLAACGGNDYRAPTPATSQVPDSASQSVSGFIDYLRALVVSQITDGLEPVDTSTVKAPVDDATENTIEPALVP